MPAGVSGIGTRAMAAPAAAAMRPLAVPQVRHRQRDEAGREQGVEAELAGIADGRPDRRAQHGAEVPGDVDGQARRPERTGRRPRLGLHGDRGGLVDRQAPRQRAAGACAL